MGLLIFLSISDFFPLCFYSQTEKKKVRRLQRDITPSCCRLGVVESGLEQ